MTPGRSFQVLLDRLTRIGCVLVVFTSALVMYGWLFGAPNLTRLAPGLASMKFNTACALLAAAVATWLLHTSAPGSRWFSAARIIAVLVAVVGGMTLAQDIFGRELGLDQFMLRDFASAIQLAHPGRMSPTASFSLVFIGLALLTLRSRWSTLAACTHWLVVPPLFVATLAVIGYAFGVSALYEVKAFASMAVPTATSLLAMGLCVLAADTAHGFASISISDTAGGMVSRRLLPTIPVMIFLLGWMALAGQRLGLYDAGFGLALMVLLSTTVCVIAVASTAITLHAVDLTRQRGEAEIMNLNAGLELRVQERTRDLAQVSSQLRLVNSALELLSQQDGLTGLANRRFLDTYLDDQLAIAHRYRRTLTVVLCDVDCFKAYNDYYGHQAGDECLKKVASALRSCCRRTADMAARYGGEEFVLILPETELSEAMEIAEAARDAVAQLAIAHEKSNAAAHVSISGGIAVTGHDRHINARQLIADADQALFEAKRLGRNQMLVANAETGPGADCVNAELPATERASS